MRSSSFVALPPPTLTAVAAAVGTRSLEMEDGGINGQNDINGVVSLATSQRR